METGFVTLTRAFEVFSLFEGDVAIRKDYIKKI